MKRSFEATKTHLFLDREREREREKRKERDPFDDLDDTFLLPRRRSKNHWYVVVGVFDLRLSSSAPLTRKTTTTTKSFCTTAHRHAHHHHRTFFTATKAFPGVVPKGETRRRYECATRKRRLHASSVAVAEETTTKVAPASGTKYEKENEIALDAVRIASTICDKVQAQLMRMDEKSITKGDKSLVTLADYAAQAVIAWRIGQDEPDMKFLGEEDADALVNGGEDGKEVLRKIAALVNEAIHSFYPDAKQLSDDEVAALIDKGKGEGGPEGRHWILDPWMGRLVRERRPVAIALALMDGSRFRRHGMPEHAQNWGCFRV